MRAGCRGKRERCWLKTPHTGASSWYSCGTLLTPSRRGGHEPPMSGLSLWPRRSDPGHMMVRPLPPPHIMADHYGHSTPVIGRVPAVSAPMAYATPTPSPSPPLVMMPPVAPQYLALPPTGAQVLPLVPTWRPCPTCQRACQCSPWH